MIPLLLLFQLFPPGDLAVFHEQRIARLQPGTKEAKAAHKDLGLFWLRNHKPNEAEVHLRQALPDPEATPFLAEALAAQGRQTEADALFKECATTARCLSRLAERSHVIHELGAFFNHFIELVVPFFYFTLQPLAALAGSITLLFHGWLAVSAGTSSRGAGSQSPTVGIRSAGAKRIHAC